MEVALELCGNLPRKVYRDTHGQNEQVLMADILFCLAALYSYQNESGQALIYAKRHFDMRIIVENKKPSIGRLGGLAYNELTLAYLLNDRFEEAIAASQAEKSIFLQLPSFQDLTEWPDSAVIHEVLALIGLNRYDEALPMLEEALEYHKGRSDPNDTQEFK